MKEQSIPYLIDPLGETLALKPVTTFGRAGDCEVVIADRRASRRHAEVNLTEEGCLLRDLDSTNGTWLNGCRLTAPAPLTDGDVIEIAGARFTFRDPESTLETTHLPRVVMDQATGEVWVDRRPVQLSSEQRALLALLWARHGQVCTKDEIARAVWPECQGEIYDYQIESLVKRLRTKIELDPAQPVLLLTVRGCGYRLA